MAAAGARTLRTISPRPSGSRSTSGCSAAARSASQGPAYRRSPASWNGVRSTGTTSWPAAVEGGALGRLAGHRHAERPARDRPRASRQHPVDGEPVGHRPREGGDAVDGGAGRLHPVHRHRAGRTLDADDPAERGGHPARAGGVGAEREADEAARPRRRPSPTRTRRHDGRGRAGCAACRRATGCRPARWRTGRGWSCRRRSRRRPAGGRRRSPMRAATWAEAGHPAGGRAVRPRRCCPSPRTARPTAAGPRAADAVQRAGGRRSASIGSTSIQIAGSSASMRATTSSTTATGSAPAAYAARSAARPPSSARDHLGALHRPVTRPTRRRARRSCRAPGAARSTGRRRRTRRPASSPSSARPGSCRRRWRRCSR